MIYLVENETSRLSGFVFGGDNALDAKVRVGVLAEKGGKDAEGVAYKKGDSLVSIDVTTADFSSLKDWKAEAKALKEAKEADETLGVEFQAELANEIEEKRKAFMAKRKKK